MLRQKDSQLKLRLIALAQKQHVIKIHFIRAPERNTEASMAFIVLGDNAKGAVPELVEMLEENLSPESRSEVEDALARIGPAAEPALPLLLRAATNSNPRIRANALWALGQIQAQPQWCVPVLMRALGDSDDWARLSAAHALGGFGAEARPAVPQLKELASIPKQLGHPSFNAMLLQVSLEARSALKKIDPAAVSMPTNAPINFEKTDSSADSLSDEPASEYGSPASDSNSSSFPQ
jgi:HEAT repeat protein